MGINVRFMALHMTRVSIRPAEPMMPPTAISSGSETAKPAMAQEMPPMELSSEMVIGMSAPPTRMVKTMPKRMPVANIRKMKNEGRKFGAML